MKYQLYRIILSYTDYSGSFNNLPKIGSIIDTEWGKLTIRKVEPMTRYTDGGATPFEVQLTCIQNSERE